MIRRLPLVKPRMEGNHWKFPKMHLTRHTPQNIWMHGAPLNYDCMEGEHYLQYFAKNFSRTVPKNTSRETLNENLAKWLHKFKGKNLVLKNFENKLCHFLDIAKEMNTQKGWWTTRTYGWNERMRRRDDLPWNFQEPKLELYVPDYQLPPGSKCCTSQINGKW